MTDPGPMSVAEARELLRGSQVFVKGEDVVDGKLVLASDLMWSALLSLEDAAEFVEVAGRLEWQFHPRGFANTDLHARYGDGIVPWLATRLDETGMLHNNPWCVVPCLLACGSAQAFDLAWRARRTSGRTPWGGVGDGDLVIAWARQHPQVAAAELLRRDEPRAKAYLRALGHPESTPALASDILALLEACALRLFDTRVLLWPAQTSGPLRVIAARDGSDWGLAIERIEGTRPHGIAAAHVVTHAFGSRVHGPVRGVAIRARPLSNFGATCLDTRLGEPSHALPQLGLDTSATIVAVVPLVAAPSSPRDCRVIAAVANALERKAC